MKSLDKKEANKLEWEKEFDKQFNIIYSPRFNGDKWNFVIKDFIQSLLTQQRTELLEEIKDIEIGESEGWELARKFNCCPGDDMADAYNQALKDVIKLIKKL